MRHGLKFNAKLGRQADHRGLLIRNLTTSLILNQKVQTTRAKAKLVRVFFEELVTSVSAQQQSREAIRILRAKLLSETTQKKFLTELVPKYSERKGGLTRMTNLKFRKGDAAPLVLLELV